MTWTIAGAITQSKAEILADIEKGVVPPTVTTFSQLHDYVDANEYGGLCDDGVREMLTAKDGDAAIAANVVQDAVNAWLAAGRP